MKSCLKIFFLYIIFSFENVISLLDFNYPSAISLSNKNVFVVEKNGIFVYDEQLKIIIYNHPFQYENDKINDSDKLAKVVIKFKANYIICLINRKIFFFDQEGKNLLLKTEAIISEESYYYPVLIPFTALNEQNNYYYIVTYLFYDNGTYKQKLILSRINTYTKTNDYFKYLTVNKMENKPIAGFSSSYDFHKMGFSCEYMQSENKNEYNYLVCFFIINDDDQLSLSNNYFEISSSSITISKQFKAAFIEDINNVVQIKSASKEDRKNSLVCLLFSNGNLKCYKFRYIYDFWVDTVEFYGEIDTNFNCKNAIYGMKLSYLADGETISLSCINSFSNIQVKFFDKEFNSINSYTQFTQCDSIESVYGHSIIQLDSIIYVISDIKCDNYKRCYELLDGPLSSIEIIDNTQKIEEENIETSEMNIQNYNCSDLEKCEECDEESFVNNLCIKCKHEKNYYYLNYFPNKERDKYIDCVNEITKPSMFYFNKKNMDYEPCYSTCATCEYGGNSEENNCSSCDGINYIKNPENDNSSNCVVKCKYFYYIEHGIYLCTKIDSCPEEHNYIIKDKLKCINNCKNDKEYKYMYNGECFKKCPDNTNDENDFICKDIDTNKCYLTESESNVINENIELNEVEKLVSKYVYEFNYTDSHVSLYKNGDYTITIYIKNKCIFELGLKIPEINFGSCYEKVRNKYSSFNKELIIAIIDKNDFQNKRKVLKYGMFSPLTGKYLNSDIICQEDKITIIDSIEDKLLETKVNIQILKEFVNEGIDIFNMSSPFYNDICFQYNSKKDIALKDRILEYFPNITLCEEGCELMGINMTTITAICECFYSESKKEDMLKNKVLDQTQVGAIGEIISSSNIYVIKCINLVFKINSIRKAYGTYIIICLIIIEIFCTIIYFKKDINLINKYIYEITNRYINYLGQKKDQKIDEQKNLRNKPGIISLDTMDKNNEPPKRYTKNETLDNKIVEHRLITRKILLERKNKINKNADICVKQNRKSKNFEMQNSDEIDVFRNSIEVSNNNKLEDSKDNKIPYIYKGHNGEELSNSSNKVIKLNLNHEISNGNNDIKINIEEYLETQFDDMEFDEAIRKDHRKFCQCYKEKLKDNQIIISIFCSYQSIRPKSIKIIFFILQVDLYFFINGLFYDEEYISNIYHLEKDTFFTMADRFFDNLIYAALAGIIINYIIEFFFIDEIKIKKIFKFNKDNILELKNEINKIFKSIKNRYLFFIIISFIIAFISLVHIFCFNIVYYHTMVEWIVFSIIIILSIQIGAFLICLIQTGLRFISFKLKSEKLYKLSL